jgi:drug/metabolite transporter (DMT)-like permease
MLAYLSLAGAMVIVGSSVVAGKIMIAALPVCLASALRFVLALGVLLPVLFVREGGLPRLSPRSWGVLALQGLTGSFLFTVFTLGGLAYGSAADAGIVTSATPACMGLIAWLFLRERPGLRTMAAIVLSAAGILVLSLRPGEADLSGGGGRLLGTAMFLAAVVVESMFLLLRKAVPEKLSPLAAASVVSLFGLTWFAPFAAVQAYGFDFATVPASSWLAVAYAGLFVTVAAYLLWFAGIVRASAQAAATMTGVMPVAAVTLSALVLGESLGAAQVAGCLLVLAAILLASGAGGREGLRAARFAGRGSGASQASKTDRGGMQ